MRVLHQPPPQHGGIARHTHTLLSGQVSPAAASNSLHFIIVLPFSIPSMLREERVHISSYVIPQELPGQPHGAHQRCAGPDYPPLQLPAG
eukprot:21525-Eustigmatos_ZCMA.PRE.1